MSAKLVPFGRYRGQPLDQMLNDQSYVEWLVKQDWFVQRFPDIHSITMNWGNPDLAQTPEHNAMQARFLDEAYRVAVVRLCCPIVSTTQDRLREMLHANETLYFKEAGERYQHPWSTYEQKGGIEVKPGVAVTHGQVYYGYKDGETVYKDRLHRFRYHDEFGKLIIKTDFEVCGWDVKINAQVDYTVLARHWTAGEEEPKRPTWEWCDVGSAENDLRQLDRCLYLELKPHVSDDYPAILRQMKKNQSRVEGGTNFVLVAGSIRSQVVSVDQIKAFFAAAGFGVVDISDHPELGATNGSVDLGSASPDEGDWGS